MRQKGNPASTTPLMAYGNPASTTEPHPSYGLWSLSLLSRPGPPASVPQNRPSHGSASIISGLVLLTRARLPYPSLALFLLVGREGAYAYVLGAMLETPFSLLINYS